MIRYKLHQPMIRSEIVLTSPFHVVCCVFGDRKFPAFKISDCFQMDLRRNWANPNDKLKMIASSIEQHVKCNKINSNYGGFSDVLRMFFGVQRCSRDVLKMI